MLAERAQRPMRRQPSGDSVSQVRMIDIHFSIQRDGCTHYRVVASQEEDYSGWADSLEKALSLALERKQDIQERGQELFVDCQCRRCQLLE
jgi:hypothetical protein